MTFEREKWDVLPQPQFDWRYDPTVDRDTNHDNALNFAEKSMEQFAHGSGQLNAIADFFDLQDTRLTPESTLPKDVRERRVGHIEETMRNGFNREHGYPEGLEIAKQLAVGVVRAARETNSIYPDHVERYINAADAAYLKVRKDRVIRRKSKQPPPSQAQ
jgi:hypothetical protein